MSFPPDQDAAELVERTWAMYRGGRLCGMFGLAMAGLALVLVIDPQRPDAILWPGVLVVVHLCMLLAWYVRRGAERSSFYPLPWRLAFLAMGALAALGWAGTLVQAVSLPDNLERLVLTLSVLGMAIVMMPLSHWVPGLIVAGVCFIAMLYPELVRDGALEDHQAEVTGYLLLLAGVGLLFAWNSRQSVRHGALEQMTQREIKELRNEAALQERRADTEYERRIETEQSLSEARQVAKSALNAKTEFLATMSHEIRTPLNGIVPILEILQGTKLDDEQRQYVGTAHNSSRHLLRIINDILDFAKADSGKLEFENIEINIRELVESVTDLMYKSADRRGLVLNVHVGADVPGNVRGDPIRIRQILTNLVSNAIKFTERGSITIDVSQRRSSKREVELLFSVTDTGMGMTQETSRRLFQVFTQADASTTRRHGGTGLGLAICKRLVELMGGSIGVRTRLGEGSTFWFILPFRRSTKEIPAERRNLQGIRVLTLLAKEEEAVRVSGYMRDWGMLEHRSNGGVEALNTLRSSALLGQSWAYRMVLGDYHHRRKDLEGLLNAIHENPSLRGLPVVLAVGSNDNVSLVKSMPNVSLIEWPIRFEQLRRQMYRQFDVEGSVVSQSTDEVVIDPVGLGPEDVLAEELRDPEPATAPHETGPPVAAPSTLPRLDGRVLVVEDNPVNLKVATKLIDRMGLDFDTAADGREAVEKTALQRYDLVLMDVQMPVMDGLEATTMIRERERFRMDGRLPIIAMTANAMTGDRERCLDAGMDDYVAKPLGLESMDRVVRHWLSDSAEAQVGAAAVTFGNGQPEEQMDVESSLDQSVLDELREVMEDEFDMVLETYLGNAPVLFGELEAARVARDVQAMVLPAHSLKSSSANVGAMQLSAAARTVETAARSGDFDAADAACEPLADCFERSIADLKRLVGGQ